METGNGNTGCGWQIGATVCRLREALASALSQARRTALRCQALTGGLLPFAGLCLAHLLTQDPAPFQHELCGALDRAVQPGGRCIGALPREHGKTTLGTVALVVREACVAYEAEREASNQLSVISNQPEPKKAASSSLSTDHCSLITSPNAVEDGDWKAAANVKDGRHGGLPHPAKSNIVIVASCKREAREKLRLIKDELEGNPVLNDIFPGLARPARDSFGRTVAYRNDELVLACGLRLAAIGSGSSIRGSLHRGRRPDLVLLDDPEREDAAWSQKYRDKTRAWCERSLLPALDNARGSLIWLGTLLHHDSVLARWVGEKRLKAEGLRPEDEARHKAQGTRLKDGPSQSAAGEQGQGAAAQHLVVPENTAADGTLLESQAPACLAALATASSSALGPRSSALDSTCALSLAPCALEGKHEEANWQVLYFPAINDDGTPLWPARWPLAALDRRREEIGDSAFNQEYLLRPVSAEAQRFRPGDFQSYNAIDLSCHEGRWSIHGQELEIAIGVDPAIGQREQNDFFVACVVGFMQPGGEAGASNQLSVISDQWRAKQNPESRGEQGNSSASLITDHCSLITGIGGKGAAATQSAVSGEPPARAYILDVVRVKDRFSRQLDILQELSRRWTPRVVGIEKTAYQEVLCQSAADHGLLARELGGVRRKFARIENVSHAAARGMLWLPAGAAWVREFTQEAYDWPSARHDDQLDALARALECGLPLLKRSRLARKGLADGALMVYGVKAG